VDLPSFIGMPSRRARQQIQELGLEVGTIRQRFDDLKPPYVVLGQEPPEGTRVPLGSTVGLVINEGD
jgi:beta-lactam-binding protein with PASTA domain